MTTEKTANRPVARLRDGNIKAAIWRNETEKGPFFRTTFSRSWRDDEGHLRDTDGFSGTQLLQLARLAELAYAEERRLRQEARSETDDETDYDYENATD